MATNWAKDGLDAYLSLTGEHRAQQRADSEEANRKQMMTLAVNRDTRDAESSRLSNTLTQQGLDKGKREAEDAAKWDVIPPDLVDFSRQSLVKNPFTLNKEDMADPVKYERSVTLHKNVIGLVDKLNSLPPTMDRMYLTKEQIAAMPPQDQLSIKYISGIGARNRAGARSGTDGTVSGDTSALMLVRDKQSGKWGVGQEVGVAVDGGGSRTAPITNGTDDPAANVKFIPIDSFASNAQSILAGTEKALASGADPTESILQEQLVKAQADWLATPLELRKKIAEDHRALQKNLKVRESHTVIAKRAAEVIAKLSPNASSEDIAKAVVGEPKEVVDHINSVLDTAVKHTEPRLKREEAKLKADEDRAQRDRENKRDNETRRLSIQERKSGTSGDGSLTAKQKSELTRLDHEYSRLSISYDATAKRLVDNPSEQNRLDKITSQMEENKKRTDEVLGRGNSSPAAKGMTDQSLEARAAAAERKYLSGGRSDKPYMSGAERGILGLGNL